MTEHGKIHTDGSRSGGQPVTEETLCRGCWLLGTACGNCSRCKETRPQQPTQSDALKVAQDAIIDVRADIDEAADFITAIPAVTITDDMVERAAHAVGQNLYVESNEEVARAVLVAAFGEPSDALREAVIEECANALEADAKKCDCFARNEGECACGAWCEWKSITSARAVEIVRALVKETPFS